MQDNQNNQNNQNNQDRIATLRNWINESSNIVFFGGAGVSTESGIPDFRSKSGIYNINLKYKHSAETMLSHEFFVSCTEEFYRFYYEVMMHPEARPCEAHKILAELERAGKLKTVITQNIDNLHQAAGSKNVLELHGSMHRNHCTKCGTFYDFDYMLKWRNNSKVAKCECGGIVKPDVVLYGEMLDEDVTSSAVKAITSSDMLIIGGTSLAVYPAASYVNYYGGRRLVLINLTQTIFDQEADLVIHDSIGDVLRKAMSF